MSAGAACDNEIAMHMTPRSSARLAMKWPADDGSTMASARRFPGFMLAATASGSMCIFMGWLFSVFSVRRPRLKNDRLSEIGPAAAGKSCQYGHQNGRGEKNPLRRL